MNPNHSPYKVVSNLENVDPKVPNQAEAKRDGVLNPQHYNLNQFYKENFDSLKRQRTYNQPPP